jgi:hypothetical protein
MPPEEAQPSNVAIQDPAASAQKLESQGQYLEAAREYQRLAATKPAPARQHYQVSAIQSYLKAGKVPEAKTELERLDISQSLGLEIPLELIRTQLDLVDKRIDKALERLRSIEPSTLPEDLQREYRQLHATSLAVQGKVREAVREWVQLGEQWKREPQVVRESQQSLWQTLLSLDEKALKKELRKGQEEVLSGWIALALLTKTAPPKRLVQAINDWSLHYPNHPATSTVVKSLIQSIAALPSQPVQITLLLPAIKSKFGKQGEAVREGFFAVAQAVEEKTRPHLKVRRVSSDNALSEYEKAVEEGADFVVGPLEREALAVLASSQPILPVPTLGLNYLETTTTTGNLYQFGLLPSDEAQEAAAHAWADGYRQPLVLVPEGDWGERVLKAFQREWEKHGGKVGSSIGYDDKSVSSLKKALKQQLQQQTADMAFMVASPDGARQIRLSLVEAVNDRFPVYSTSHVYSGTPDSQKDKALNGVMFIDMPWVLMPDRMALPLQNELQQSQSGEAIQQFRRLYAFGVDAYGLLSRLQQANKQSQFPWQGQTGRLFLNNQGEIHRDQLQWARFVDGVPQVMGDRSTPTPTPK